MFFDTLESRRMFSTAISSSSISIPDFHLPTTIQAQTRTVAKTPTAASRAAAAKAAASKALVNAVLASEIKFLSDLFAGKVENLAQDLSDLKSKAAKAGGQLQSLLGSTVTANVSVPKGQLAALRGMAGATDHLGNLIGTPLQQMVGNRNGQLSDDPSSGQKGVIASIIDFFTPSDAKAGASNTANYALDVAMERTGPPLGGEAVTILRGPSLVQQVTGDAKDLLNGVIAIFNSGDKDPRMPDRYGNVHTPVPDDVSNSTSGVITAQDLKGLLARLGSKGTPTGEESKGTGGAINTGASGTGKLGSQATFTPDSVSTAVTISVRDLAALAIRLTSKIHMTR